MFALGPTVKFVLLYNCERREKDVKKIHTKKQMGVHRQNKNSKTQFQGQLQENWGL